MKIYNRPFFFSSSLRGSCTTWRNAIQGHDFNYCRSDAHRLSNSSAKSTSTWRCYSCQDIYFHQLSPSQSNYYFYNPISFITQKAQNVLQVTGDILHHHYFLQRIPRLFTLPSTSRHKTDETSLSLPSLSSSILFIKRTFQPSILRKKRKHGFLARLGSVGGRKVLKRRLLKGRSRVGGGL